MTKKIKKEFTSNEAIEMMHHNTADALKRIADFAEKYDWDAEKIIDWMRELIEEMEAQALVVSLRDELNFTKPK